MTFDFFPLSDPYYVDHAGLVCDVEHTSSHVGMCGRMCYRLSKFVECIFGDCQCFCPIRHSGQNA